MSITLLETVQQNLGFSPLQKIDTETGLIAADNTAPAEHKFSQAAIPAVLTALYNFSNTDDGADAILKGAANTDWAASIFNNKQKEAVQKIAAYATETDVYTATKLNAIAAEAVRIIKEKLPADGGIKEVKAILNNEKNSFLLHLLPALQMGELLNNNTLDDNTNKMEGPISSLMNSIGAAFSAPVAEEDVKKNT